MKLHIYFTFQALLSAILVKSGTAITANDPSHSIRDNLFKILAANGCTNRVVALLCIDIGQNVANSAGVSPASIIIDRLDNLSGLYTVASLNKW